jgi:hypothetical protein
MKMLSQSDLMMWFNMKTLLEEILIDVEHARLQQSSNDPEAMRLRTMMETIGENIHQILGCHD